MDKIEVTQADFTNLRDLIAETAADLSNAEPFWTAGCLADALIKKGVVATRTDATLVTEVAELRGNISIMEAALRQIAGTHAERFGMCQTDVEEVPDLSAEEAVSIARNALEAAGDTHPPATDVAALVDLITDAKSVLSDLLCEEEPGTGDPDDDPLVDLLGRFTEALAPFTKGQP